MGSPGRSKWYPKVLFFPNKTVHNGHRRLLKTAGCAAVALILGVFQQAVKAETIQGGVAQSVAIEPVKPGLRMGDTFDKGAFPQFHTTKS
jgi:hypothetical protein